MQIYVKSRESRIGYSPERKVDVIQEDYAFAIDYDKTANELTTAAAFINEIEEVMKKYGWDQPGHP